MRIYKDNLKTVVLSSLGILAIGLLLFWIGSFLLSPRPKSTSSKTTYKPKITYPNGPIKLTYWRTSEPSSSLDQALDIWKQKHANIAIDIRYLNAADYDKALAEAANKGRLPDLFMIRNDWVSRYKDYIKTSPKNIFSNDEYKAIFAPVIAKNFINNDEIYAVSYGLPTLGLFYNSDLFASSSVNAPPADWQNLLGANSKLVKKSGDGLSQSGISLGTANVSSAGSIMPLLMIQNGAVMTNSPPSEATFQNPDSSGYKSSAKALDFYTSFARPNKSSFSWSDGFGSSVEAFGNGKVAMIIDYPNKIGEIKKKYPNLNFKTAKAPQVNLTNPINYTEFWGETVNKNTLYPEVAWDFYNFMTSYESLVLYSASTMNPASRTDLAKDQEQDGMIGSFAAQTGSAQDYYKGNNGLTDAAILEMINTNLSGFDSSIAVKIASEKVTTSIKQYPFK